MESMTRNAMRTVETRTFMESPIGWLRLSARVGRLSGVHFAEPTEREMSAGRSDATVLDRARRQLDAYFAGKRTRFELDLDAAGTAFQRSVWGELAKIPFGVTRSYLDIAVALGNRAATRAVGGANGRNPLSIIVPCHRVIGSAGHLVGYAGGEPRKRWLLAHEGVDVPR